MVDEIEFLELLADVLEIEPEDISPLTDYRTEIEDWDSLKGFMIITTIEENFEILISVEDFEAMNTIGDLYNYVKTGNGE
jgi:acyl carrier protein